MFKLLRAALLDINPVIQDYYAVDWDDLIALSTIQGVLPWVWDGICRLPIEQQPSREVKISCALSVQEIEEEYNRQKSVLHKLVDIFAQKNIKVLLLKGIGLSVIYPRPQLRSCGDIDIYLYGDYKKGNEILKAEYQRETELHSCFYVDGIEIENHKVPVYPDTKQKRYVGKYLVETQNESILTDDGYYTFAPLPNLAYLIIHALNHIEYNTDRPFLPLRQIVDISMYLYVNRNSIPPKKVCSKMQELGLAKSFDLFVSLSECILQVDLSDYHTNVIGEGRRKSIKHFFSTTAFFLKYDEKEQTCFNRSITLWRRYHQFSDVIKCVPSKRRSNMLLATLKQQGSIIISG